VKGRESTRKRGGKKGEEQYLIESRKHAQHNVVIRSYIYSNEIVYPGYYLHIIQLIFIFCGIGREREEV
jgi:hypothetical protein